MSKLYRSVLKWSLFSGAVYAIIMAGFDALGREAFNVNKFIYNFLFFGVASAFFHWYNAKHNPKSEE